MNVQIRNEESPDREKIYRINLAAFPTDAEAKLVDQLRLRADLCISLVAARHDDLIGHLMLSPVTLDSATDLNLMGLAPMAVLPEMQNQGIGSLLVTAGLQRCQELGIGAVVVLGHPQYYPSFGFVPASQFGISSHYDVPDEVFMAQELIPDYLAHHSGKISYHPAFAEL
ncbi:MAG: N-acetyltransferase [Gammaproteobacteria bacterium]